MMHIIVGLGNPGEEYAKTRHNAGRIMLEAVRKAYKLPEWEASKKYKALVSKGDIGGESVMLALPETFMNKSGQSVVELVPSAKAAERMIVICDDLDLPLGKVKMVFNRGSGGHKGVESIVRAIKTEAFVRIRVGVSPTAPSGKIKKPQGEEKVHNFIIGAFKPAELDTIKKLSKKVVEGVELCVVEGRGKAMNVVNTL